MIADFTCALAIGRSYSIPLSPPPLTTNGAKESFCRPMIWAPICFSGSTIRCIGRLRREPSPVITETNGWEARMPESRRIDVPLFPASKMSEGSVSWAPWPFTV